MPDDTASPRAKNQSETILASPSTCPNKPDHLSTLVWDGTDWGIEGDGFEPGHIRRSPIVGPLVENTRDPPLLFRDPGRNLNRPCRFGRRFVGNGDRNECRC